MLIDINAWGALTAAEKWGGSWAAWSPYPLPVPSRDVPSFGPGLLTDAHRPNERITTQAILDATAIYADTARRFLDA